MNEKQRAVAGTTAIALIVAALFYIPWKIESSGDLKWAPFYRGPVLVTSTGIARVNSRFVRLKGRPVYPLYALQLILIGSVGVAIFRLVGREDQ